VQDRTVVDSRRPDGNLWFSTQAGLGNITTAGTSSTFAVGWDGAGSEAGGPGGIVAGPDGDLWFTDGTSMGKATTAGVLTQYAPRVTYGTPQSFAVGPDGAMWYTENPGYGAEIPGVVLDRITTDGVQSAPLSAPDGYGGTTQASGLVAGPDGALWYTDYDNGGIVRVQ